MGPPRSEVRTGAKSPSGTSGPHHTVLSFPLRGLRSTIQSGWAITSVDAVLPFSRGSSPSSLSCSTPQPGTAGNRFVGAALPEIKDWGGTTGAAGGAGGCARGPYPSRLAAGGATPANPPAHGTADTAPSVGVSSSLESADGRSSTEGTMPAPTSSPRAPRLGGSPEPATLGGEGPLRLPEGGVDPRGRGVVRSLGTVWSDPAGELADGLAGRATPGRTHT
mmetsp:Transcript_53805/g.143169  ORF Transcript_53805/g.143169 Transcript_53805/m.143169 type:complete len:221 (-) Transcript_53805:504-1166(-)